MKARELIFVDLRDKAHVDWINSLIRKGVKLKEIDRFVATDGEQEIGKIFDIRCLNPFKRNRLIKESNKFLGKDTIIQILKF